MCEKCGKPMLKKYGKNGEFLACSGYPDCKNTKALNPISNTKKAIEGVKCPKCGGEILERMSRRGKFYGCGNYPKCDFATWDKPIEEKCPRCSGILVEKKDKVKCLNCDYEK